MITNPTEEGVYVWIPRPGANPVAEIVQMAADGQTFVPGKGLTKDMGGTWDRQVSAAKMERAFEEGFRACQMSDERLHTLWLASQARQDMLGKKP